MRKQPLITGQYYHIYNRGVDKRDIFMNKNDLDRFILSIIKFNIVNPTGGIKELFLVKNNISGVGHLKVEEKQLVSIVCYCINPNHFHFILKQEQDGGISEFMKRLLGGYTNYFNQTYDRSGALFQGRFKSHMIATDRYFLKIYPYVNVNYLVHDIPDEKKYLIRASDMEYEENVFNLVSKKEADNLLEFYGGLENFKEECKNVVEMTREERGKDPIFLE